MLPVVLSCPLLPVPLPECNNRFMSSPYASQKPAEEFSQGTWETQHSSGEASGTGAQQQQQQPAQHSQTPQPQHQPQVVAGPPTGPNDMNSNLPQGIPPEYAHHYPPQQGMYMQTYPYTPYGYYPQVHAHFQPQPASMKRTFQVMESGADGSSEPIHKRVRHCVKCGSNECKGKGGRAFCTNPCQDCGKLDCKGRNSKRPDRTCADAWP
jgi:hypothetical protein